jgi:Zn-dependent metalloprotease
MLFPAGTGLAQAFEEFGGALSSDESEAQWQSLQEMQAQHAARWDALSQSATGKETAAWIDEADLIGAPPNRLMVSFSHRGVPRSIWGWRVALPVDGPAATAEQAALSFLKQHAAVWGMDDPGWELFLTGVATSTVGSHFARFEQLTPAGRVFDTEVVVEVSAEGRFVSMSGLYLPHGSDYDVAAVSGPEAEEAAYLLFGGAAYQIGEVELGVFDPEAFRLSGPPTPAWRVTMELPTGEVAVYVDGMTGDILHSKDLADSDKLEHIYQCAGCTADAQLPGTLVWQTGQPFPPPSWPGTTQLAYEFANDVYDYFLGTHARDSWDNNPASPNHRMLISADTAFDSPKWVPSKTQVATTPNVVCLDVVGHEFAHGVDYSEANLGSDGESGALNESYPDVFGEFIEQWATGTVDWLHHTGAGCAGGAVRSLAAPCGFNGHNDWADHWSQYCEDDMSCNAYDNMGIASKAAYLVGAVPPHSESHWGVTVSAIGPQEVRKVWYDVLVNRIAATDGLATFGRKTIESALSLFGTDNRFIQTRAAIYAVGLWTGEGDLGIQSDRAVALISDFAVGGQSRKWIFWKDAGSQSAPVRGAWRTCAIVGSCQWSSALTLSPGQRTNRSVSSVVFGGKIWVFYRNAANSGIYYSTIDSAGQIVGPVQVPGGAATPVDPAATVVAGKLVLAYKNSATSNLGAMVHDGTAWGSPVASTFHVDDGVRSVLGLNGTVWASYTVWDAQFGMYFLNWATFDVGSGSWGLVLWVAYTVMGAYDVPSSAVYRGRWHVGAVGDATDPIEGDNAVQYTSCGPSYGDCVNDAATCTPDHWTAFVRQDHDLSPGQQHSTLFADTVDGRLYLILRHPGANSLYWRFKYSQ